MERAYSNPPESKSENSNPPTHTPSMHTASSHTMETLSLMRESLGPVSQTQELSASQIARDLRELCDMGLLEKFRDERGITRYRPIAGRVA